MRRTTSLNLVANSFFCPAENLAARGSMGLVVSVSQSMNLSSAVNAASLAFLSAAVSLSPDFTFLKAAMKLSVRSGAGELAARAVAAQHGGRHGDGGEARRAVRFVS